LHRSSARKNDLCCGSVESFVMKKNVPDVDGRNEADRHDTFV